MKSEHVLKVISERYALLTVEVELSNKECIPILSRIWKGGIDTTNTHAVMKRRTSLLIQNVIVPANEILFEIKGDEADG